MVVVEFVFICYKTAPLYELERRMIRRFMTIYVMAMESVCRNLCNLCKTGGTL